MILYVIQYLTEMVSIITAGNMLSMSKLSIDPTHFQHLYRTMFKLSCSQRFTIRRVILYLAQRLGWSNRARTHRP